MADVKQRYSDEDLEEFKAIIRKNSKSKEDLDLLKVLIRMM